MEELVRRFNSLPRPKTINSGLPNHWVFGVRHVPIIPGVGIDGEESSGDILSVIHPATVRPTTTSQFFAGPGQIIHLPLHDQAEAIVRLLLDAYITGHRIDSAQPNPNGPPPFAPWSWATEEAGTAKAVEAALRRHGVVEALCHVGTCSVEEKNRAQEVWSGVVGCMMSRMGLDAKSKKAAAAANRKQDPASSQPAVKLGDDSQCHNCRKALTGEPKRCSGCRKAYYCNPDCQKADWKRHKKPDCSENRVLPRPSTATAITVDAFIYHNSIAHSVPEARALAQRLNLTLVASLSGGQDTKKPLRRLVVTGNDSPENFQLLFGPSWQASMQDLYVEIRMEVLLNPPHGSPSYAANALLDNGGPSWSPRPASDEEQTKIREIRAIQAAIRQRQRPVSGRVPDIPELMAVFTSFDPRWPEKLPTYKLAVITMDQGVPV